jgi:hypothetical protein
MQILFIIYIQDWKGFVAIQSWGSKCDGWHRVGNGGDKKLKKV